MIASRRTLLPALLMSSALFASTAQAASEPQVLAPATVPTSTLTLQASVSEQVPLDEMVVVLAVERSGAQVGGLNAQVLAELNALIEQARAVSGLSPRLGSLHTSQRWMNGRADGWTVRGEVVLEGRDLKAVGDVAGKLSARAQLASVSFRLSDARRTAVQKQLLERAGEQLRAKAQAAAHALGFRTVSVREMALTESGQESAPAPRPMVMMAKAAMADAPMPVPVESGKVEVSVTFSGTVVMGH